MIFDLTQEEANIVLSGLVKLPYEVAQPLIVKIHAQGTAQVSKEDTPKVETPEAE
jgi:hypothetical protein